MLIEPQDLALSRRAGLQPAPWVGGRKLSRLALTMGHRGKSSEQPVRNGASPRGKWSEDTYGRNRDPQRQSHT